MQRGNHTNQGPGMAAQGLGAGLVALLAFLGRHVDDAVRFGARHADDVGRGVSRQADDLGQMTLFVGDDLTRVTDRATPTRSLPNAGNTAPMNVPVRFDEDGAELLRQITIEAVEATAEVVATSDTSDD